MTLQNSFIDIYKFSVTGVTVRTFCDIFVSYGVSAKFLFVQNCC